MDFYGSDGTLPLNAYIVTKSDVTEFDASTLYIGVTGDVTVDMKGLGTNITFTNVPVGVFPYVVTRVYSTGTTASEIVRSN